MPGSVHVDHEPPLTFDRLLFEFCEETATNPLNESIGSRNGVVAFFENRGLASYWSQFHETKARLRLTTRDANLRQGKGAPPPWDELF